MEMDEDESTCGHKISFANEQFVLELMVRGIRSFVKDTQFPDVPGWPGRGAM